MGEAASGWHGTRGIIMERRWCGLRIQKVATKAIRVTSCGGAFNFRGDGDGSFVQRNGSNMRVRDVSVNLARNGSINLAFQAQGFPGRLTFTGRATRYNRDSVNATLSSGGGTHATTTIYLDRNGSVDRIDMNGSGRDGDFRLNWRSR